MADIQVYVTVKRPHIKKRDLVSVTQTVMQKLYVARGGVSIHLIGADKMRTLNRQHRGKNYSTDVLSFGLLEGSIKPKPDAELGDLFLCVPVIERQAKEWSVSYKEELYRMLIHGLLHLVGYDHVGKREADKMFALQEKFLGGVL